MLLIIINQSVNRAKFCGSNSSSVRLDSGSPNCTQSEMILGWLECHVKVDISLKQ
jgi:hypothetical protein